MKTIRIPLVLLQVFAAILCGGVASNNVCLARVGEAKSECIKRYGEPVYEGKQTAAFVAKPLFIACQFDKHDICVAIAYVEAESDGYRELKNRLLSVYVGGPAPRFFATPRGTVDRNAHAVVAGAFSERLLRTLEVGIPGIKKIAKTTLPHMVCPIASVRVRSATASWGKTTGTSLLCTSQYGDTFLQHSTANGGNQSRNALIVVRDSVVADSLQHEKRRVAQELARIEQERLRQKAAQDRERNRF